MRGLICMGSAFLGSMLLAADRQVDVRVRTTAGGPQIQVDGQGVSPRMFWGIDNPRRRPVDGTWRRHRISFTPRADAAMCRFELNPQKASGRFEVRGLDTNALYRAERDKTRTFDFEARAEGAISYFRPSLVQLAPKNEHFEYHRLLSVTPDDPEDSNFISQCRAARRAGVRFFSFFAPNLWPERGGEIEFAVWDKTCDALIAAVPDALIVPRVTVNPPDPWLDAHPEVKMVSETGETWNAPSIHAPLYRAVALDYTRRVARHFMERYPRHFAGLHMTGQSTQEWYYWGSWEAMSGYDTATRAAYRRWLKAEGLPEADVPSRGERHAQDAVRGLIDPSRRPNVIRFNRFLSESMVDFMGEVCRATREATDGRKLVFSFYGYAYELVSFRHGVPASGNCALQRIFEKWADAVDILCAPLCYTDRAWLGTSPAIGPVETVNRNGMFWLNEDDLRTHLVEDNSSGDGGYAPLYAPGETADAMRRTMLQEIVRGAAGWWMDHGTGWYDSWDEIWRPVADLDVLERASLARRRPYTPEVAVLADEDSLLCCGTDSHLFARPLLNLSRFAFPRAGVSYGQYMLQDVLAKPLSDEAKLRIHPCTIYLTPEKERRLAAAREAAPKVVRAWCHLPGLLSEKGLDTAGVERLTGFAADLVTTGACVATATALGRHLGLPPSFGVREPIGRLVPRLKDGDEVWATWADGSPAVVVRGNGTGGADALVGTAELPAELIRALALRAGARSLLAADEVNRAAVWRSDDLEVVQSLADGFRDFRKGEVRVRRVENAARPCGVPGRSPLDAR